MGSMLYYRFVHSNLQSCSSHFYHLITCRLSSFNMTRYTTCLLCSFIAYFASSAVAATVPSQITDGQIQAPTAVAHVSQTSDGQIQAPVENGCPPSSGYTGASPTVTIANGVLHGTTVSLPSATAAVNKFLGVPFAQSPPLRFAPPQPAKSWATPLDVTVWKPACIQQFTCKLSLQYLPESV